MAFLNQKQDVFDIKLTSHGRKLLAEGKLKPAYYAFFDEDIVYDAQATMTVNANFTAEPQNSIEKRIKEETPRMSALYNWTRLEEKDRTETKVHVEKIYKKQWFQDGPGPLITEIITTEEIKDYDHDKEVGNLQNYIWQTPLGTAELGTQLAPSWNLQAFKGNVSSTKAQLQNHTYPTLDIPQINIDAKMLTIVQDTGAEGSAEQSIADANAAGHLGLTPSVNFPDGSYLEIRNGEILLSLEEENSLYQKENFDVEVFVIENPDTTNEEWISLYFNPETTKSDLESIPFEVSKEPPKKFIPPPEFMRLDNFLEIEFDNNISKEVLCQTRAEFKTKNLFSDLRINCTEIEQFLPKSSANLYEIFTDEPEKIC